MWITIWNCIFSFRQILYWFSNRKHSVLSQLSVFVSWREIVHLKLCLLGKWRNISLWPCRSGCGNCKQWMNNDILTLPEFQSLIWIGGPCVDVTRQVWRRTICSQTLVNMALNDKSLGFDSEFQNWIILTYALVIATGNRHRLNKIIFTSGITLTRRQGNFNNKGHPQSDLISKAVFFSKSECKHQN